VAEELHATGVDGVGDRIEKNVLLSADRRPATSADVLTTSRRLADARDDLQALAGRIATWEAANGPLPANDAPDRDTRTADAVLRHIGHSDVWLAGRLDRAVRYSGPPRDGDLVQYLAATRAWAVDQLIRMVAHDEGAVVERSGEHWTLAKVMRRLIYHSLDHLGELDRRLANAEGAVDRLTYRRDVLVRPEELTPLFRSVGWYRLVRDPSRTARLLEGSTDMVSAWETDEMVGFARAISDQAAYGLISTVAVHPRWQGKGVARRLITRLLENNDGIRFSLSAVPGVESLYESVGFVPDERAMVRRRLR
jgi:GNAT superfamily N-acetyltransferase